MAAPREILRRFVLFANRWSIGARLNRQTYHLAAAAISYRLLRYPEAAAVYARNSFAQGRWTPGLSDIDLTVAPRSGLDPEREFAFCRACRREEERLRRIFPMIGEIEILRQEHTAAWTAYAVTGYESAAWRLLAGDAVIVSRYPNDPERLLRDRLAHAAGIYRHRFAPGLNTFPRHTLVRLANKIFRYLDEPPACEGLSREALLLLVLDRLEAHARRMPEASAGGAVDLDRLLAGDALHRIERAPLARPAAGVRCALSSPSATWVILEADAGADDIARCSQELRAPLLMRPALFTLSMLEVDPLEYLTLLRERTLLQGCDPLPLCAGWTWPSLRRAVGNYAVHTLTFPCSATLETASHAEFQNLLFGWLLRTARFFEDGVMDFDYYRLGKWWQERYPEDERELGPLDRLRDVRARFFLARRIADRVARGMEPAPYER